MRMQNENWDAHVWLDMVSVDLLVEWKLDIFKMIRYSKVLCLCCTDVEQKKKKKTSLVRYIISQNMQLFKDYNI